MEGVAAALVDQKLAKVINPPWITVEAKTAEEFMYYLALVLGRHKNVQFTPVTDEREKLQRLSAVSRSSRIDASLENVRIEILEHILPAPSRDVSVVDIERFKEKFGDQLATFRRKVEMELISLVDIKDAQLRKKRTALFKEACDDEIEELKARMKEAKWPSIVFGKLCALLGPVPVVGQVASVINAAYTALGSGGPKEINSPLAYAAYARTRLLHN